MISQCFTGSAALLIIQNRLRRRLLALANERWARGGERRDRTSEQK
jgi:hypothetical protein